MLYGIQSRAQNKQGSRNNFKTTFCYVINPETPQARRMATSSASDHSEEDISSGILFAVAEKRTDAR